MGLGSEFSVLQSMDDDELISPEELGNLGESETKLKSNGAYHVEDVNKKLLEEIQIGGTAVVSSSETVVSLEGIGSSSPAVNKRQGLKKWRRIPREFVKKTESNLNSRENGDLTASPVRKAMVNANGNSPVRPVYARSDSDQSSRSSTAASAPRIRNELSNLYQGDSVLSDDQQRNGRIGPGKKARGFQFEKENSNSTMGSDSRSSDFVFVQGSNTVASKDRQSGTFAKYDEESSDDDKHFNEEGQITFIKNDAESDDVSLAADNIGKQEESMDQDPLLESIKGLHFAQGEFEREIQKWRDVGKDDLSIFDDPILKILELKDAKIMRLESILNSGDFKTQLEDQLMKIIQADVEYVVITTTTERLTEGPLSEIKHNLQQKNESSRDIQAIKKQDEKFDTRKDLKKLQNRVCRFTSCFMIQLILLLVTLYLKFCSKNVEVIPT